MLATQSAVSLKQVGHWQAELKLNLERRPCGKTVVASRHHTGPYVIQRAFYPEADGSAHLYLLHPPGGMVGGDKLTLSISLGEGAEALVTAPSAGKIYRCLSATAAQHQTLSVGAGATLEWLPQEMIVFEGGRAALTTTVNLADETSQFIGWDFVCLGRAANELWFETGELSQKLEIKRTGKWLLNERLHFDQPRDFIKANFGLAGNTVVATALFVACPSKLKLLLEDLRELCETHRFAEELVTSVTLVREVLILRVMGRDARFVRDLLVQAWVMARPKLLGKSAEHPRIWMT
mgnify:CR=1 FL=1